MWLFMLSCTAHGKAPTITILYHTLVMKAQSTTSNIHPFDGGIVASLKNHFGRTLLYRIVDITESGWKYVYNIDVLAAME